MNSCCYVSFSMSPYLQCLVLLAKPTWSLNHFRQAVLLRPMKYSFLYSKMFLPNLNHPRFLLFKQFKSHLVINLSENLLISHIYLNPLHAEGITIPPACTKDVSITYAAQSILYIVPNTATPHSLR